MAVRKRKRKRSPSRSSGTSKINFMKGLKDLGKPTAIVAGAVAGTMLIKKLKKNQTVSGLMGAEMKDYIIPGALAIGGALGTQLTKNQYIQLGLIGAASVGVGKAIEKATGKTILQGLEGLLGDDDNEIYALNAASQSLPAADIDIEREIRESINGAAEDYSMTDDPVGSAANDFSMTDDPVGTTAPYPDDDYPEETDGVGKIKEVDPDSMDYDIFSGDMMEA